MSENQSPRVARLHEALDQVDNAMVLLALHEKGVYGALSAGPATAQALATQLSLVPHRLAAFMHLAANLGVIQKSGDLFNLFEGDAELFDPSGPNRTGLPSMPIQGLFQGRGRGAEILGGAPPNKAAGSGGDAGPEKRASFLRYIDSVSQHGAAEVAELLPDHAFRRTMDLGGGGGTYTHAVLTRFADAEGLVVDRPDAEPTVLALAEERGFTDRLSFKPIDFILEPLPTGRDLVILSNVIHCFSAEDNQALITKIADSLAPGGILAIKDYWVKGDYSGPLSSLRFGVSMALYSEAGGVYSAELAEQWCHNAGFARVEAHEMARAVGSYLVIAQRPH